MAKVALMLIAIPIVCVAFLYLSYINDYVRSGSAYGFRIGASKVECYTAVEREFRGKNVYIVNPTRKSTADFLRKIDFDRGEHVMFYSLDRWDFYFDERLASSLELYFENDSLVEIHRKRAYFEFP